METTKCSNCGKEVQHGDWPYCPHESTFSLNAQRFDPVVYFENADGKTRIPGRSDTPTPPGYQRVELKTLAEVRSFERRLGQRDYEQHEQSAARDSAACEVARTKLRRELRSEMERMSNEGRDFARYAIEQTNNRPRRRFDPRGVRIEVFS